METKNYNIIRTSDASFTDKLKSSLKVASVPAIIASLCCLSPLILVMTGLATVSFATSLSDTLYGTYKWAFRTIGLVALLIAFYYHLQRTGICTLDDAKKHRNEIINKLLLVLIVGVLSYIIFLYVIVEYAGKLYGVWG